MIIKKKRKEVHEEPIQKKKKVKSSGSQTVIKVEKDVQSVIKTEDDDQLETKTKVRKKENLKEDECLDQLELKKKKKKKNKKNKVDSELLKEAHSESFMSVEGHLDSEPEEKAEDQIKILKKKKKKAQCHSSLSLENNQSSDVELSNHHTDGAKENECALKKSRKNTALNLELAGEVTKKKKKTDVFSLEDIQDSEHKQSEKVRKKPHKYISQEAAFTDETHGTDIIQNDGESYVRRKKRKKKKDKSDSILPLADNQDNTSAVPDSPIALRDFGKRQRKNSQEVAFTDRGEEDTTNSGSVRETKRKKKKSKDVSSLVCEDDQDYSHRVPDQHLPAQQEVESEEEEISGKTCRKTIKDNSEVIKKKKKKKIQKEEEETTYSEVFLSNDSVSKSQNTTLLESNKKSKEGKMQRAKCVTGDIVDGVLCNSNHMLCDRKRKKRKKEVPEDFAEKTGSKANTKKKKIKREDMGDEAPEHVDDVTIVQEKKGNCDEVNIDKVRRQALQEEIDRESGKTKVFSPKVEQDAKFGQWSTAAFQSSEEQMKFFRLMGGFKKGSVPIQNLSATTNKPNMALNREGEEKLQQALKMEFDKAMDLKQHRGIGLGFQPAANKKVYIDKYTSRSIKFED
ncbi:lysine-rich nucleolar protein 1 [Grus americana]|nr:lysine-rich nucleolar protein 1 [Grus americana]XP_054699574.1 lysine-rich nucleolar protein 1 [Grus americana]XP_054699575.1 lysine-rich nucleolar protein 1 [Grus americana]XP_054699576.1 lysine-rich nucleolar protein 1 [Grus americana]